MSKPKHAERAHAKYFSPSSADRWMTCTASPKYLEKLNLPEKRTASADEGTAAHELLDTSLKAGKHPRHWKGKKFNKVWEADQAMVDAVGLCWEWVMAHVLDGYELVHEHKVFIEATGDSGTLDIALIHPDTLHLIIGDLKYGKGVAVSPEENKQMRLYGCGFMDKRLLWDKIRRVSLVILQPRACPEPKIWDDKMEDLHTFRQTVAEVVRSILGGSERFQPSQKACLWCRAKAQCKAYARAASESVHVAFDAIVSGQAIDTPDCASLPIEEIVSIYNAQGTIKAWLKSVDEFLWDRLQAGKPTPGLKLVASQGDREWADESKVMSALARMRLDPDDYAPRKLLGLGKVGALIDSKPKREEFLTKYTIKPPGSPKMVRDDDSRPAVTTAGVAAEFADL